MSNLGFSTGPNIVACQAHPALAMAALWRPRPAGTRQYISDEKQITFILTQNGIVIPIHLKFFRV